ARVGCRPSGEFYAPTTGPCRLLCVPDLPGPGPAVHRWDDPASGPYRLHSARDRLLGVDPCSTSVDSGEVNSRKESGNWASSAFVVSIAPGIGNSPGERRNIPAVPATEISGRLPNTLRFDARAVAASQISPTHIEAWLIGDGKLGRQFLIEIDPKAGP